MFEPGCAMAHRKFSRPTASGAFVRIRIRSLVALVAGAFAFASAPAHAAFPYRYEPGSPPDDLTDKRVWMYAATPDRSPDPLVQANNADHAGKCEVDRRTELERAAHGVSSRITPKLRRKLRRGLW